MPTWVITIDTKIGLSVVAMFIIQIISFTAFIVRLDSRITQVEEFVERGDRFTQADGELLRQELQFYKNDVIEMKEDIKVILTTLSQSNYHNGG